LTSTHISQLKNGQTGWSRFSEGWLRSTGRETPRYLWSIEAWQGRYEKAFEIIGKAREKYIVELTRKEMAEGEPIKNFEDFKAKEKERARLTRKFFSCGLNSAASVDFCEENFRHRSKVFA
jgi:hypothetical protein